MCNGKITSIQDSNTLFALNVFLTAYGEIEGIGIDASLQKWERKNRKDFLFTMGNNKTDSTKRIKTK